MSQQALAKTENPFSNQVAATPANANNAVSEAESQRAIQEVQAAMVIAKKFPRDPVKAMDRILNACTRPTLAAAALYSYPRGGQEVTGPSIRLAEAMAQEWGNMQFGIREQSVQNGMSTVEAFAWDVETNTRQVKVFQVSHIRYSRSKGNAMLTDPRDIYEHIANQGARRLRTCILGVIPGDVTEAAVQQCGVTQSANVNMSEENIKKMVGVFQCYGVTDEMIQQRIGRRVSSIQPAQVLQLHKILASLKDGMSKPADWFDISEDQTGGKVSELNEQLATGGEPEKPAPAKQPAKKAKQPLQKSPTFEKLSNAIDMASSHKDLEAIVGMPDWSELAKGEAPELQELIKVKREGLQGQSK